MKKLIALLTAGMLITGAMGSAVFAAEAAEEDDEIIELNWSDIEDQVEENGLEGEFVTFDDVAVQMWIPDGFQATELTEEDTEAGYIGYYMTEDGSAAVAVVHVDVNGMELEEYADLLAEDETIEDIEFGIINGLACLSYSQPEQDSTSVSFATEDGYIFEVTFAPVSDEGFEELASIITLSIMPEEVEE